MRQRQGSARSRVASQVLFSRPVAVMVGCRVRCSNVSVCANVSTCASAGRAHAQVRYLRDWGEEGGASQLINKTLARTWRSGQKCTSQPLLCKARDVEIGGIFAGLLQRTCKCMMSGRRKTRSPSRAVLSHTWINETRTVRLDIGTAGSCDTSTEVRFFCARRSVRKDVSASTW